MDYICTLHELFYILSLFITCFMYQLGLLILSFLSVSVLSSRTLLPNSRHSYWSSSGSTSSETIRPPWRRPAYRSPSPATGPSPAPSPHRPPPTSPSWCRNPPPSPASPQVRPTVPHLPDTCVNVWIRCILVLQTVKGLEGKGLLEMWAGTITSILTAFPAL